MQGCLVKIAQGLGSSPSVSATFNAPDVRLYWVIPEYGSALNYEMLLQVFHALINLNVRETSPFPNLIGRDFTFVIIDRTDGSHMGDGIILDTRVADSEILAKRSVDPSSPYELLQPVASQQPSTTASLSSKYVHSQILFPCHLHLPHKLTSTPLIQHYRRRNSVRMSHPIHSLHPRDPYILYVGPTSTRDLENGL